MKMKSNIVYLFLLIGTVLFAQDVQFNAKLSKNRLGVNERLRVDFIMNQDEIILELLVLKVLAW